MLKRGIISKKVGSSAEAIIPDENNTVTALLPFARSINEEYVYIGENCVVAFFDAEHINFADGVIIAVY